MLLLPMVAFGQDMDLDAVQAAAIAEAVTVAVEARGGEVPPWASVLLALLPFLLPFIIAGARVLERRIDGGKTVATVAEVVAKAIAPMAEAVDRLDRNQCEVFELLGLPRVGAPVEAAPPSAPLVAAPSH